ncbi:serine/threonine protein kinase [Marinihelvus fidelis]|uniref:Serine/threonine protein kinase n=1 Tax=Marinihelvus fidelis TaxID=2613842 RepID=A0A5N0TFU5_9GAMM|nr:tetratricopeptide repeat protein [Marinihelvus fidelis]KAA9133354.1 serine/threonine protein kinase [Marinihelvus fidelis]
MNDRAERDRRIAELLEVIIDLEPEEQARVLAAREADPELARHVLKLAAAEDAPGHRLDQPLLTGVDVDLDALARAAQEPDTPEDPETIGPFTRIQLLGEGGMGRVYLAHQSAPVERDVALKVMRHGLSRDIDRLRFDTERQALARLNHPNIAQIFEAGTTETGHPWFAMEWVRGVSISQFSDEHRLGVDARLRLFMDALLAIQHAHQNQLLHRDLKPSNILVTAVDDLPMVKIIDFGIAEGLDDTDAESRHRGQRAGTPGYAPPESLPTDGQPVHLDTRSDIYTLGVTLYELLCDRRPFDRAGDAPTEVWRRIREDTPPTPAAQVAGLHPEEARHVAGNRSARPDQLVRTLSGDLGAIVMKAMARDREQRYGSISAFYQDLVHYLSHEPVTARANDFTHVAALFFRRRAGAVIAAAMLLVAMGVGLVAWSEEARRAAQEAQRAQREALQAREALAESRQLSDFVVDLFELTGTRSGQPQRMTTRELLDLGAEQVAGHPSLPPLERARLMQLLGEIYTRVYALEPARTMAMGALTLRREHLPATHTAIADSLGLLGDIHRIEMQYEQAEPLLLEALAIAEAAEPPHPAALAVALERMASLYWIQDRTDDAIAALERALDIREVELGGADELALADALFHLGNMLHTRGRDDEAQPYLAEAARLYRIIHGDGHVKTATTLNNLAQSEEALGQLDAAESHYRDAIAAWHAIHGHFHPRPILASESLARALGRWGRPTDGMALAQTALDDRIALHGGETADATPAMIALGVNQALAGHLTAAAASLERARQVAAAEFGEQHARTQAAMDAIGWLNWYEGEAAVAERIHRKLLEARQARLGEDHALTAFSHLNLGLALGSLGRFDEAVVELTTALDVWSGSRGSGHRSTALAQHYLGLAKWHLGDPQGAEALFEQALATRGRLYPPSHRDVESSRNALEAIRANSAPLSFDARH